MYLIRLRNLYNYIGTVYLQTQNATSILTGFGVFICASGLFMFPAIYNYLLQAMNVSSSCDADAYNMLRSIGIPTIIYSYNNKCLFNL